MKNFRRLFSGGSFFLKITSVFVILFLFISVQNVIAHITVPSTPTTSCGSIDSVNLITHVSNQIDNRLALTATSSGLQNTLFTTRNISPTSTAWTRNSNVWTSKGTPLDFTGVSGWNTQAGDPSHMGVTMITPRHFIGATHYVPSAGKKVYFYDLYGNPIERTIIATQAYNSGDPVVDLTVGVLDSDVPDSITYYPIMSDINLEKTLQPINAGNANVPIVVLNQDSKAIVSNMVSIYNDNSIGHAPYTTGTRSYFSQYVRGGDSGQPAFLIVDNQPVLLFVNHYVSSGTNIGHFITNINSMITGLGNSGGYQVTEYDPTCFTKNPLNQTPRFMAIPTIFLNQGKIASTTIVNNLAAIDADVGDTLSYSFVSLVNDATQASLNPSDYFTIGTTTANLYQKAAISTSTTLYTLTIKATDSATTTASSTQSFPVRLYNFNSTYYTLDPGVKATVGGQSQAVAYDQQDRLYAAGIFTFIGTTSIKQIARLNLDGSVDQTFTSPVENNVVSLPFLAIRDSGKILLMGSNSLNSGLSYSGGLRTKILQINTDGSVDNTFQNIMLTGPSKRITGASLYNDKILTRSSTFDSTSTTTKLIRYNGDGTPDASFQLNIGTAQNASNTPFLNGGLMQSSEGIFIGGMTGFTSFNGTSVNNFVKLNLDGTIDTAFMANSGAGFFSSTTPSPLAFATTTGGKIIAAGAFTGYNTSTSTGVVQLNSNGTIDSAFAANVGNNLAGQTVNSIIVQPDGKILLGGNMTTFGTTSTGALIRLNTDGTLDRAFQSNLGFGVTDAAQTVGIRDMARRSDGAIAIAGTNLNSVNGETIQSLAVILTSTPEAPSIPDLSYNSDTGYSHTDDLTASTTVTIAGLGAPGAVLHIFDGNTEIATTSADSIGNWEKSISLSEGVHSLSSLQVLTLTTTATSATSTALAVTVDTTAPTRSGTPTISGNTVTIPYDSVLDTTTAPDVSIFSLNSSSNTTFHITSTSYSGNSVILTLLESATGGQSFTLSYSGPDQIKDIAGNNAATFTDISISNLTPSSVVDTGGQQTGGANGGLGGGPVGIIYYNRGTSTAQTINGCIAGYLFDIFTGAKCSSITTTKSNYTSNYIFNLNLIFKDTGSDIRRLQMYLNTHGFPVATKGVGSIGKETSYFGPATVTALAKFQKANGIKPAVGYFGPVTRKFVNGY